MWIRREAVAQGSTALPKLPVLNRDHFYTTRTHGKYGNRVERSIPAVIKLREIKFLRVYQFQWYFQIV